MPLTVIGTGPNIKIQKLKAMVDVISPFYPAFFVISLASMAILANRCDIPSPMEMHINTVNYCLEVSGISDVSPQSTTNNDDWLHAEVQRKTER
jgi:hypothetical protein